MANTYEIEIFDELEISGDDDTYGYDVCVVLEFNRDLDILNVSIDGLPDGVEPDKSQISRYRSYGSDPGEAEKMLSVIEDACNWQRERWLEYDGL